MLLGGSGGLHSSRQQAQVAVPAANNAATLTPPLWQGRASHGEDAAVLGRNPDGTFQVRLNGTEKTFKESQVAAMTGMQRGPLHEMLGRATGGSDKRGFSGTGHKPQILPHPERSSFYKAYNSLPRKGASERAAENRKLRDSMPPRHHPPSSQMHLLTTDAHGMAMQKAMLLVDHAHDDGELGQVKISHRVDHAGALGTYRWAHGVFWAEIGVSRDTPYPLMTTIHEIGHHVRLHLAPDEVAKVATVARKSEAAATCIRFGMDTGYWLSDSELFSRIYAQWVTERSRDGEAAQELHSILKGINFWQQFGSSDWRIIRPMMDNLMDKKGWL